MTTMTQPVTGEVSYPPVSDARAAAGPAAGSDQRVLTVAEVAGVMRVSKMTVYRLVHSGELAAHRIGRSFRVPAPAVTAYLASTVVSSVPAS